MKTPESVSTMQYHCLSLAEIGEDEEERKAGATTKGFVKGFQGNRRSLFPLACFCYNAATQMDS